MSINMEPLNDEVNRIDTAQNDMRTAYANGSIGIIVSGLMWLTAAIVAFRFSEKQAVWTLLIGGMLIHPLSLLFYKIIGLKGAHTKDNKLANLAMEGTIWMLMCLPLAFGLSLQHTEWFFHAMLMIIGGRYLTFASIYGNKLYWVLGAALGLASYLLFSLRVQSFGSALTGSLIEITFGIFMFVGFHKN
jgi:hypothetical protein